MKRMKRMGMSVLLVLALLLSGATGCRTAGQRKATAIVSAAGARFAQIDSDVSVAAARAKSEGPRVVPGGVQPAMTQEVREQIDDRIDVWAALNSEKAKLDHLFSLGLGNNADRAGKIARNKTVLGMSGVAAGLTGAVLTVASPANAVWVAAFSGWAGSVAGMNGVFDENGFSRQQIAALQTVVIEGYAAKSKNIKMFYLLTLAKDPSTTTEDWQAAVEEINGSLQELRAVLLSLKIPTVQDVSSSPPAPAPPVSDS